MFGFDPDMVFRIPALLIALTVHEYAHARAAVSLGDPTPRYAGRLTLNPIPHLDPIGLIMLWLFRFGWAKPVPINPFNLRNGRWGIMTVSLAGPGANIVMAFVSAVVFGVVAKLNLGNIEIYKVIQWTYTYNLILAVFNLIPVPPLDGSQIVSSFLPPRQADAYERIAPYGPFILMALVYLGVVGAFIYPVEAFIGRIISAIVALIV
ncbi:site-2 protease family protein [Anaeroselena agilis]|uniref:Site-2 protease family protein n=1 Tax=Anaeroselena agilis TaxID=3063788 RepID=A0ABU3NWB3_9FIRM|nr:site-2 protease family protein [Selenomonadales bacterium 4137-cl]